MLSDRIAIDLNHVDGIAKAEKDLRYAFARLIANHEEGLVLKADEAAYNDSSLPWVKVSAVYLSTDKVNSCRVQLKKDYIPGYGDSLDFAILAVGWDKDRARELRGTFFC
jgi:DNA ligase-4